MTQYNGSAYYLTGAKKLSLESFHIEEKPDHAIIRVYRGGICGSDVHYYFHGGNGNAVVREPMLLGHEVIGRVEKSPAGSLLHVGMKVAINPSLPCGQCEFCLAGVENHCKEMKFMGSAMRLPHVQGGFAQYISVEPERCIAYDDNASDEMMCFAEPLAVALHAVNQAPSLIGKRVLISGAGPIGCLIALVAQAAGASSVTAFDINANSRALALKSGANDVYDPASEALDLFRTAPGYFDIAFDASGAQPAVELAIATLRPRGTFVQVGNSKGLMPLPVMTILNKEITFKGSFRFANEFRVAVKWLESGKINPLPLLSSVMDSINMGEAIELAADKDKAAKIQLTF
ncbi:alcohol dehydrogenase catalytic domain-containing protein [Rouxiella sp. T17]|uniref:zinc-binding dehydrogenase n=1 Tax=Rouxiella sp. T17 TaxID=3085684 RepID=UPI002FC6134F